MTRIGAVSPEFQRRIVSATQYVESQREPNGSVDIRNDTRSIVFKNASGHAIPPFGLMQIKESTAPQGRRIIEVIRPLSATGINSTFLVNNSREVANNGFGTAQSGPIYSVKKTGLISIGHRIGWKASSFDAELGCLLLCIGPDRDTDIIRAIADFSMLTGTVSTTIPANLSGTGEVATTSPSATYKARTRKTAIASGKEVYMWPSRGEWLALEIC